MDKPRVYSFRHKDAPPDAVRVDRASKFGNPFVIGADGNRQEVIEKYDHWLGNQVGLTVSVVKELKGKNLICWCAPPGGATTDDPPVCHGQVLLRVANGG